MATLGNTGTPDTAALFYRPRACAVYVGQMPSNGTLTNISVYCNSNNGVDQPFSVGVFTGSATYPVDYVTHGTSTAVAAAAWKTVSVSAPLTSGQHIWVVFVADPSNGDNTFQLYGTAAGASANVRQGNNTTGVYPVFPTPWANNDTFTQNQPAAYITYTTGAPAAVISGTTPSGTIGTTTTATIGGTTDQASGTLYTILSKTQADVTGASAANIKAGQKADGSAAAFSGNAAVSTTSPSISISGLTGNTLYYYAVIQNNSNGDSNIISSGSFTTAIATPTVTSLSSNTPNYLGSLTITGTNFPTSQSGSAGIAIGGVAQTVTWNTSTSCSISSIGIGTNKFGTSVDIVVTDASGNASTGYATTFSPRSGGASVDLSGTMASSGVRLVASPDIAAGDQIEYYGAIGGTIPADVTVNNDGTYDTAAAVTGFYWRVWTAGGGWGAAAFETVDHAAVSSGDTGALFKTMMGSLFKTLLEAS